MASRNIRLAGILYHSLGVPYLSLFQAHSAKLQAFGNSILNSVTRRLLVAPPSPEQSGKRNPPRYALISNCMLFSSSAGPHHEGEV